MNRNELVKQVEELLVWSKPREVPTKRGARMLRTAEPNEGFWRAWRAGKEQLKALGISCARNDYEGGKWEVTWWEELPPEVVAKRAESVEASRATDAEIDVPAPDGLSYMPFQRAGIRYALLRSGTLIGDEMGLGKTIQAIGVVNAHPEWENVLVVTKASLKVNWWRELRKWLVSLELRNSVGIVEGKVFPSTNVVVINYDVCAKYKARLHDRAWDAVILDEAHLLKNPQTIRAKAIIGYKPKRNEAAELADSGVPAKVKLALTGTPIENNLKELWTVLWWLDREKFPSVWKLLKLAEDRYAPGVGQLGATNRGLSRLQTFLRENVMIRRLKSEVLVELPPKTRFVTEFTGDEFEPLIRLERETWEQYEDDRIEAQAAVEIAKASDNPNDYFEAVEKLKKVAGIAFTEMARIRHDTAVAKIPRMEEQIRTRLEEDRKILVFAHHIEVLERLHAAFPGSVMVHGGHSTDQRDRAVHRFQTEASCPIFFGSIRATGEGLTLTAATHVMFHELDWVPSKMVQCEDRAHRIGQKDNVTVEVCIVDGTIDAKMAKTCVQKADLADKALDARAKDAVLLEPPPVVTDWKPLTTRKEMENFALLVTEEQREAIHAGLQSLAGMCDGARRIDDMGFSKMDVAIGKKLAFSFRLSDRQTVLGAKLVNRYHRQLDARVVEIARDLMKGTKSDEQGNDQSGHRAEPVAA